MKVNNFFEKVFVINLPHRDDRLQKFDSNAKKHNIEYEIFPAFNGKTIGLDFEYNDKKYVSEGYFNNLTPYHKSCMGCSISHLEVLKFCKNKGYENILILEDDTEFVDDFENKFNLFTESFITEWDLLFLSGTEVKVNSIYKNFCGLSSCYTSHSYSVNKSAYDILIEKITNSFYYQPLDVSYSQIQNNIKSFICNPILTFQYASYSDIHDSFQSYSF